MHQCTKIKVRLSKTLNAVCCCCCCCCQVAHSSLTYFSAPPSPHPDVVQPATPNPYYRVVHFDVSSVDLTNSTLVKAEFRIFRAPNPESRALEQRVELYQVSSCG